MASTAGCLVVNNRTKIMRRQKPKFVVMDGGKELEPEAGRALLLDASDRFNARKLQRRLERTRERLAHSPERQSVAIAMLAVEEQIVKALWTIARQPLGRIAPIQSGHCGIEYLHEPKDIHAIYADAAGGKWDSIAPRPALPSAKDITQADRVQDWLLLIDDEDLRKLLVMGATSKRGDAGRQVNWRRIGELKKEYAGRPLRSLNALYQEALRIIVSELTLANVG